MAQRATTRSSSERSQVQVRQAAGAHRFAEAHPDGARGAEEAAPSRFGEVLILLCDLLIDIISCVQTSTALSEREGRAGGAAESGAHSHGEARAEWWTHHQSE